MAREPHGESQHLCGTLFSASFAPRLLCELCIRLIPRPVTQITLKHSIILSPPLSHPPLPQSVWGSFYDRSTRSWGYACCHAALASSYCTGAAGRAAREDAERYAASAAAAGSAVTSAALSSGSVGAGAVPRSSMYGEQLAPTIDPVKLKAAMEKQARKEAAEAAAAAAGDGDGEGAGRGGGPNRKRGYNSLSGEADAGTMTAEDMEVWKLKRSRVGDPMAQFGRGSGGGGGGGASGAGGGYGEEDDGEG